MEHHLSSAEDVMKSLSTGEQGLSDEEALARRRKYGENSIKIKKSFSAWKLLLSEFTDTLVVILIIAAVGSYVVGFLPGQTPDATDSILILAIVALNGAFGFFQNYKAERSVEALRKLESPSAVVIRNGLKKKVDAKEAVPGDLLLLSEGSLIPADCRIIRCANLTIDESMLTGESNPAEKNADVLNGDLGIAERKNMAFSGTMVARGNATCIVVKTGMDTELGKIADILQKTADRMTPFQAELEQTGRKIGYGLLMIIGFIAAFQYFAAHADLKDTLLISVSLAVAAIPEGLPAVVTVSLALGMRRMLARNTLVRKMPSVETLGSVNVICTDKTGTITENMMTVTDILFSGKSYSIKEGKIFLASAEVGAENLAPILKCGVICNDAFLDGTKYEGDPTEAALLPHAMPLRVNVPKRVWEIPFSASRKMMTVAVREGSSLISYTKGAPEIVIEKCSHILFRGRKMKLTSAMKKKLMKINESMASRALRVLAFAVKEGSKESAEKNMTFLGMQGMIDPPRKGVKEAVAQCRNAGIRIVIITGDNKLTAKAVASEVGIGGDMLDGKEIDAMGQGELSETVRKISIFARVSPEHKVRILKALQANGNIVAMTGDGVNDAPALKSSDVGIAMGLRGTDVAKQASQLVLLDDNFSTIVAAVKEGRTVFSNIRKFVNYLLSSNVAEVSAVFFASLAGYVPITAVQLLWINLLTDGLPALALAADPPAKNVMSVRPRDKSDGVINGTVTKMILATGAVMTCIILSAFFMLLDKGLAVAQTAVFTGFVMYEFMRIVAIRREEGQGMFSNRWLILALCASFMLQLAVIYTPLSGFFGTVSLGIDEWVILAGLGIAGYGATALLTSRIVKNARKAE
ncbi:MAG: calcium-translocating P-type ATPase, PMCA-type [Candidatus Aenigmarchaeota archaeon]|nr:calcium-translocating P-type ATPase, PMCA-type [Candidatus Aenigmarchaeota archaeon]